MKKIGEILVQNGLISLDDLNAALVRQKNNQDGRKLGEILIDMGLLTYDSLLEYLEHQLGSN